MNRVLSFLPICLFSSSPSSPGRIRPEFTIVPTVISQTLSERPCLDGRKCQKRPYRLGHRHLLTAESAKPKGRSCLDSPGRKPAMASCRRETPRKKDICSNFHLHAPAETRTQAQRAHSLPAEGPVGRNAVRCDRCHRVTGLDRHKPLSRALELLKVFSSAVRNQKRLFRSSRRQSGPSR